MDITLIFGMQVLVPDAAWVAHAMLSEEGVGGLAAVAEQREPACHDTGPDAGGVLVSFVCSFRQRGGDVLGPYWPTRGWCRVWVEKLVGGSSERSSSNAVRGGDA